MNTTKFRGTMMIALAAGLWASAALAATDAERCQADKNQAAGKYAACRQKAEKKFILTGDATKYADSITKCTTKFTDTWQRLEEKAVAAGATCPDAPLIGANFQTVIDQHTANIATALSRILLACLRRWALVVAVALPSAHRTGALGRHQLGVGLRQLANFPASLFLTDSHCAAGSPARAVAVQSNVTAPRSTVSIVPWHFMARSSLCDGVKKA
jgi:hypothetical protein